MTDENLVFSDDPERLVRLARERDMTDQQIIDNLVSSESYAKRRTIAKTYAPALGMSEDEFLLRAGRRE